MKPASRVLVTGAGGFIGHHLVKRLKAEGCWVRGVDIKEPEFEASAADEFELLDLRFFDNSGIVENAAVPIQPWQKIVPASGRYGLSPLTCTVEQAVEKREQFIRRFTKGQRFNRLHPRQAHLRISKFALKSGIDNSDVDV